MAKVTLLLPELLRDSVGVLRVRVEGRTVSEAMEAAYGKVPALRHHLCEESGRFRNHVLCFLNGEDAPASARLKDGDEISIHQAISGG